MLSLINNNLILNWSKVFDDEASMLKEGLDIAKTIASKSPIAVQGSKVNLVYSRDHSVEEGLKFMVTIFIWKICVGTKISRLQV